MSKPVLLHVLRDGSPTHSVPLTEQPLHIGRGPSNGLVLSDPAVSTHHAMVWIESGDVWIRDLDSKNGTFVDESPIRGAVKLDRGVRLRLGSSTELEVEGVPAAADLGLFGWMLEDVEDGVCFPIASNRFYIGSGSESHLRITGPERAATLLIHANGEVWVGTDDKEYPIASGEVFEVEDRVFKLVPADAAHAATVEAETTHYPYSLTATLNGATGPEATLEDYSKGVRYRVDADNRAILLYLLARQILGDRESGVPFDDQGWCSDDDITAGIWGRNAPVANSLHVLVYRLRKQLKKAGFDPWFIEKRHRAIRARLTDVKID